MQPNCGNIRGCTVNHGVTVDFKHSELVLVGSMVGFQGFRCSRNCLVAMTTMPLLPPSVGVWQCKDRRDRSNFLPVLVCGSVAIEGIEATSSLCRFGSVAIEGIEATSSQCWSVAV